MKDRMEDKSPEWGRKQLLIFANQFSYVRMEDKSPEWGRKRFLYLFKG